MGFPQNGPAFGKHNVKPVITPLEGPNANKPYTLQSGGEFSFDPAGQATHMAGFSIRPVCVIPGAAQPTGEISDVLISEAASMVKHIAPSGGVLQTRCRVEGVFSRQGMTSIKYQAQGAIITNSGGFNAGDGGALSPVQFSFSDLLLDGKSIFDPS